MWEVEHPGHGARASMDGVIVMTGIPRDVDVAELDAAVGKVLGRAAVVGRPSGGEKAGLVHRLRRRFGDEVPAMVEAWRVVQGLDPAASGWVMCGWASPGYRS